MPAMQRPHRRHQHRLHRPFAHMRMDPVSRFDNFHFQEFVISSEVERSPDKVIERLCDTGLAAFLHRISPCPCEIRRKCSPLITKLRLITTETFMETVAFITAEAGDDLVVSFAVQCPDDPSAIESLILL